MSEVKLRGQTLTVEKKLVTEECCECGMLFAITEDYQRRLKNEYKGTAAEWFYCPRGHRQHYLGESEAAKLKKQLDEERRQRQAAEQRVAMWQDWEKEARQQAEHERNRANGYKGHATRISKRAKAGVCPCCNRTFKQLAQHMATKHPQFTPMELEQRPPEGATVQ